LFSTFIEPVLPRFPPKNADIHLFQNCYLQSLTVFKIKNNGTKLQPVKRARKLWNIEHKDKPESPKKRFSLQK